MKTVIIGSELQESQNLLNLIKKIKPNSEILIYQNVSDLKTASHFILHSSKGVSDLFNLMNSAEGFLQEFHLQIMIEKKPLLAIEYGMQILSSQLSGEENSSGIAFLNGKSVIFKNDDKKKISCDMIISEDQASHFIVKNITSYRIDLQNESNFVCQNDNNVIGYSILNSQSSQKTNLVIAKANIVGVQFNLVQNEYVGSQILNNFLNWRF